LGMDESNFIISNIRQGAEGSTFIVSPFLGLNRIDARCGGLSPRL
jgi:hypothetical protein